MIILVLNCGSSSLKFQLIETSPEQIATNTDRTLGKGLVERIGSADSLIRYETPGQPRVTTSRPISTVVEALAAAIECVGSVTIDGVGHRVVHGGEQFTSSTLITPDVLAEIEAAIDLAPLHNPHNLKGYQAARQRFPLVPQVAVFDTSFHHTLPPKAFLYGLPYVYYTRDRIRRYGFHGTSHRYVSYRFAQLHATTRDDFKLITCHLGNGCSVCAIDRGESVDTSMGFTPLEGLLMGTRPGDLDPGVLLYLSSHQDMGLNEVDVLLNKHSGLLGISGHSNDMRELVAQKRLGNERARLAIDVFCYRVTKYIGAYLAVLNGADALLFAGGIGENSPEIRSHICASLTGLGIRLDPAANAACCGAEAEISAEESSVRVWTIPTNEELLIARDTVRCMLGLPLP